MKAYVRVRTFVRAAVMWLRVTLSLARACVWGRRRSARFAAAGVATVACARRPRVAILATGSELAAPGDELAPGQIYESNGLMLAAALAAVGADIDALLVVADDESAHGRRSSAGSRQTSS